MIYLKNAEQLQCMRKAGGLLYEVLCRLREAVKPGMSTTELDVYAEQMIRKHKAIPSFLDYQGYPASICASVNDEVVHGIPADDVILKEGDVLSVDCGLILDGWQADSANAAICEESPGFSVALPFSLHVHHGACGKPLAVGMANCHPPCGVKPSLPCR